MATILKKKALVVVAHCDDAILWMGGIIHHLRDWEWHIFSMCNNHNEQKIQSFNKSCEMLLTTKFQALSFLDYSDGLDFSQNKKENMKSELCQKIDDNYDYIFTHGTQEWNEYSRHPNHQETGIIVSEIATERKIPLLQFCYYPIYGSGTATVAYKERAHYYFQLNYEELKFKLSLINCFPQEMPNLISLAYPCPNPECFESTITDLIPPFIKR